MQFVQIRPLSFGKKLLFHCIMARCSYAGLPLHQTLQIFNNAPIRRMIHLPKVLYTNPFESPGVDIFKSACGGERCKIPSAPLLTCRLSVVKKGAC
ncbi:1e384b9e-7115-47d0-9140-5effdb15e155-CDS [Sclerotinia trifoliorum]|uniref:1e384b9e-7115-47d0-9140-5effdb15e155-CDS n=1 Tax=Sclerotinia trifoliorum TaxID=28548 RepID=A0A8H2W2Q9_9HELO|nr:1e384b9e-7115-47d0-9140-5effdb15e155-CDS [Sclerotinia trifoliorum]